MLFDKLEIGETIWWNDYSGTCSGKLLAKKQRHGLPGALVIETSNNYTVIDVDPDKVFLSLQPALLNRAQVLQREASDKLRSAADLFTQVGVELTKDKPSE